ncbi:MAG: hypothetical protein HYY06_29925 [Deltaproteobacteria bacterium]|nr:hypothetical protein [Deltaproteobacteria bacterium]
MRTYRYWLAFRNGDVADGGWEGESVSYHPDCFWRPSGRRAAHGNPLDAEVALGEIGGGQ